MAEKITTKTFWLTRKRGNNYITEEKVDKVTSLTPLVFGKLGKLVFDHCNKYQMRGQKDGMAREITVTLTG